MENKLNLANLLSYTRSSQGGMSTKYYSKKTNVPRSSSPASSLSSCDNGTINNSKNNLVKKKMQPQQSDKTNSTNEPCKKSEQKRISRRHSPVYMTTPNPHYHQHHPYHNHSENQKNTTMATTTMAPSTVTSNKNQNIDQLKLTQKEGEPPCKKL